MVRENTNTQQYKLVPEGNYLLTVLGRPEKRRTANGKGTFRIWKFAYTKDGIREDFNVLFMPWESGELLTVLGGVKLPNGTVDWDDEEVDGKSFRADIVHRADNKGQLREKLENIQAEDEETVPF